MSAISHFGGVYAQNAKTLPEYMERIDAKRFPTVLGYRMTPDDHVRKFVIMRLMCDLEVDQLEVEDRYKISFDEYFSESLQQLTKFEELGLVSLSDGKIMVEPNGRFLLRNIAMCFDAYLNRSEREKPLFSKTI
jgi:oxygen-independent coproporphyrinogen-3 oxidase